MSDTIYTVRQGDTEPLNFTLQSAGSGANITGFGSVSMFLESTVDSSTTLEFSTVAGTLTVATASSGACYIEPTVTSFLNSKSTYKGYVIVVDSSGNRASFPESGHLIFKVLPRLAIDD